MKQLNAAITPAGVAIDTFTLICLDEKMTVLRSALGRVAELARLPSANAPVVHGKRLKSVDLGVEVLVEPLGRRPVHGGILACSAARLQV
jgi:hypothetical protein